MAIDHPHHVFCLPTRFFRVPERIFLQIITVCINLLKCAVTHSVLHRISFREAWPDVSKYKVLSQKGVTPNQLSLQATPSRLVFLL